VNYRFRILLYSLQW